MSRLVVILLVVLAIALAPEAAAQLRPVDDPCAELGIGCPSPDGFDSGVDAIKDKRESLGVFGGSLAGGILAVITWVLSFGAILALAAIVWGGISYIIALGNDQDIQKAKKILQWAIIGLLVMGLSFAIISAIQTIFT